MFCFSVCLVFFFCLSIALFHFLGGGGDVILAFCLSVLRKPSWVGPREAENIWKEKEGEESDQNVFKFRNCFKYFLNYRYKKNIF